ncbi:unnamed protein product [Closterium sp. NIES-53]
MNRIQDLPHLSPSLSPLLPTLLPSPSSLHPSPFPRLPPLLPPSPNPHVSHLSSQLRGVESTNASSSSASTNRTRWYFAHATLADALARYPSAAGVLWCNDDVILNYWALAGANTSRIWFPNNPTLSYRWVSLSPSGPFTPDVPDWTNNPPIRQMVREAVDSLSPPLRARFEAATAEHEGMYTKRIADVVYVPMRHAPLIADHLLPVFSRVYSEVRCGEMQ